MRDISLRTPSEQVEEELALAADLMTRTRWTEVDAYPYDFRVIAEDREIGVVNDNSIEPHSFLKINDVFTDRGWHPDMFDAVFTLVLSVVILRLYTKDGWNQN